MFTLLSLVTAVKDYVEVVHKLVETNPSSSFEVFSYNDLGAIVTYIVMTLKDFLVGFFTFKWLQNVTLLPFIIPNVASAMLSEISVLDGYFHNAFTFLESPISYGNQNFLVYGVEKFSIGLVNSLFLCLPTSVAHIITLRRFVMQGLEAGYLAGLGTIAGNLVWIGSILFGLRFIVIPWLSLDLLRYGLGTLLLVKYMWDSYSERRTVLEDLSKKKIFALNFLLAFTEQATIYPFVSNLSFGSDATILETFPTASFFEYSTIHIFYLLGLFVGSLSLLQLTCWFWENPAFNIYMWAMSSLKVTNGISQRFVNLFFLYLTMLFSVANLAYFGLDYTLANPLGLVHEDRLLDQKGLLETSFLNSKASDRNTRRNRGRHGRRERWKRRVRRYRTFDASVYDQGVYDLFTIEDLNYGFDRFWLRRKIRNHRVRFRFFPGPWMRSFKKQLAKPRLESFMGPRVEFFRILFEQSYHPEFHEFRGGKDGRSKKKTSENIQNEQKNLYGQFQGNNLISYYSDRNEKIPTENLMKENSALRKFIRKVKMRTKAAEILMESNSANSTLSLGTRNLSGNVGVKEQSSKEIYSKRWKQIFSKMSHRTDQSNLTKGFEQGFLKSFYKQTLFVPENLKPGVANYFKNGESGPTKNTVQTTGFKQNAEKQLSKKDRQILRYKTFLQTSTNSKQNSNKTNRNLEAYEPMTLLHPVQFYLQKEQAFNKKMKFYGATLYRNFGVENNAPYYRIMMKKFFYYYKPTLRWERTMRTATMRKARRKGPRIPRKLNVNKQTQMLATTAGMNSVAENTFNGISQDPSRTNQADGTFSQSVGEGYTKIQKPTHFYSLVSKRATRYRYQIYKDVLQHWYYSPFNRLLLKFDVDAFIRRQPASHFLTKKEENLLHLKRVLLYDYYNSLRWYSSMEHYDAMKKKIGKTKSFANNAYNQQFFGTFKKIRHLFAITPSLSENTILKFDQPLFNEYKNNEPLKNKNGVLFNSATLHEELLADTEIYGNPQMMKTLPETLTNQATTILKEYLKEATPERQNYIRQLLEDKNYTELTNFLLKGQKTRGTGPVTHETLLLAQEQDYLNLSQQDRKEMEKQKMREFLNGKIMEVSQENSNKFTESLNISDPRYAWIALLQKSKNMLYNQEALKSYVQTRVEKMEKRKKREEKAFQTRLENMKKWVSLEILPASQNTELPNQTSERNNLSGLKTSVQKAVKEGLYYEITGGFVGKNLEKTNLRNNRERILQNLGQYLSDREPSVQNSQSPEKVKNLSLQLKSHLNNRVKIRALDSFEAEKMLRKKLSLAQELFNQNSSGTAVSNLTPTFAARVVKNTLLPFTWISKKVSGQIKNIYNSESSKTFFQPLRRTFKLFNRNREKTLENWKKRETVLSTRKKIRRKIYRVLDQKKQPQKISNASEIEKFMLKPNTEPARQKKDDFAQLETDRSKKTWKSYEKTIFSDKSGTTSASSYLSSKSTLFREIFEKNFKKKRTRSRRYRRFKGRGPIKKHTLAEKLKRQFKLLKRYGEKANEKNKKMEILEMITKRKYNPEAPFEARALKQRRTRQSKHRYWKKHKRQKYLQMKRKQRKRRRYSISKLRVLNKEFKRIQSQAQIKQWWWQTFLPKFMSTSDAFWEAEGTKQIKQEFDNLSLSEILERDQASLKSGENALLQIGDKDFKPLALPQALRVKQNLEKTGKVNFGNNTLQGLTRSETVEPKSTNPGSLSVLEAGSTNLISNLSKTLYSANSETIQNLDSNGISSRRMVGVNPMPFYAGWDETLRQFVITNRLLSRQDAGYNMNFNNADKTLPGSLQALQKGEGLTEDITFTKAPLQGMNAATTLYWQIPFTTYDPDQFFALGMDGFSPLGWRFFNFKHSKETTKPMLVQNLIYTKGDSLQNSSLLSYNIQLKMLESGLKESPKVRISQNNKISKNQSRKIQKRQKRVKKHPRPPVWFPSGPLTNQVLPVHYIYVFYKRTRLPRDRYLGRRFRRADDPKATFIQSNFTKLTDFTLRKRVKPIRKYHRKRTLNKGQDTSLVIRRRPFKALVNEAVRFRPLTKTKLNTQTDLVNSSLLKTKQRKRNLNTKPNAENLRIRQLRRRVQRQVLRPVARYKPRPGGFVWPGDYLRLESVTAPTLKIAGNTTMDPSAQIPDEKMVNNTKAPRKKKRRAIQEWQIQPKKYLLQKHNLKVLKKRLQQSQNFEQSAQKIKTLNLML